MATQQSPIDQFRGHKAAVIDVSHHPTHDAIATASDDETIKIINRQGRLLATWQGPQNAVLGVSYAPDGRSLVSGHNDGTVRIGSYRLKTRLNTAK